MNKLLWILFLCLWSQSITAQNYYVASLVGDVYYNDTLLKKRDRISLEGSIRFSDSQGLVKLSGPGGLYTLSADMAETTGSEFMLTLSQELFPKVRSIGTVAMSISTSRHFRWKFAGETYSILEGTQIAVDDLLKDGNWTLLLLHETEQGLQPIHLDISDNKTWNIREQDFQLSEVARPASEINRSGVLLVRELGQIDSLLAEHTSLAALKSAVDSYMNTPWLIDSNDVSVLFIDEFRSERFVSRQQLMDDIGGHIHRCRPENLYEFYFTYRFHEYITSQYGNVLGIEELLFDEFGLDNSSVSFQNTALWDDQMEFYVFEGSSELGFYQYQVEVDEVGYSFLSDTELEIPAELTPVKGIVGWLHQTEQGLIFQKASVRKKRALRIREKDLVPKDSGGARLDVTKTAVILMKSQAEIDRMLAQCSDFDDVWQFLCSCYGVSDYTERGHLILAEFPPSKTINQKEFIEDMKFLIEQSNPESVYNFLIDQMYSQYIYENYGRVYGLGKILFELGLAP